MKREDAARMLDHAARCQDASILVSGGFGYEEGALCCAAKKMLCLRGGEEDCTCASCRLSLPLHPDFSELDLGAAKIAQVRQALEDATLGAAISRVRVMILTNADGSTPEIMNLLLKTLEEEQRRLRILMTARSPLGVLPTVRSRCACIDFPPCSEEEMRLRKAGAEERPYRKVHFLATGGDLFLLPAAQKDETVFEEVLPYIRKGDATGILMALHLMKEKDMEAVTRDPAAAEPLVTLFLSVFAETVASGYREDARDMADFLLEELALAKRRYFTRDDAFYLVLKWCDYCTGKRG